jgi:predicted enzyme related to lactoylglutathione lyase
MGVKTLFLGLAMGSLLSAQISTAAQEEQAHFHHVHLNVTNPEKTLQYYQRVFGATPVKYNDAVDALYTERSFILLNKVDAAPPDALNTGIWRIGWGGVDMTSEAVWLKAMGVDIHTPLTPLSLSSYCMYLTGCQGTFEKRLWFSPRERRLTLARPFQRLSLPKTFAIRDCCFSPWKGGGY